MHKGALKRYHVSLLTHVRATDSNIQYMPTDMYLWACIVCSNMTRTEPTARQSSGIAHYEQVTHWCNAIT